MKGSIQVVLILTIYFLGTYSHAEEQCNPMLEAHDTYESVSKKLLCLHEKIQALEGQVRELEKNSVNQQNLNPTKSHGKNVSDYINLKTPLVKLRSGTYQSLTQKKAIEITGPNPLAGTNRSSWFIETADGSFQATLYSGGLMNNPALSTKQYEYEPDKSYMMIGKVEFGKDNYFANWNEGGLIGLTLEGNILKLSLLNYAPPNKLRAYQTKNFRNSP